MSDLRHQCGIAAVYHLPGRAASPLCPAQGPEEVSRLIPRMLLDMQNRGQLSAGITSFNPGRRQLLYTYKDLGGVSEVFRLNHRGKSEALMQRCLGHRRPASDVGARPDGEPWPRRRYGAGTADYFNTPSLWLSRGS